MKKLTLLIILITSMVKAQTFGFNCENPLNIDLNPRNNIIVTLYTNSTNTSLTINDAYYTDKERTISVPDLTSRVGSLFYRFRNGVLRSILTFSEWGDDVTSNGDFTVIWTEQPTRFYPNIYTDTGNQAWGWNVPFRAVDENGDELNMWNAPADLVVVVEENDGNGWVNLEYNGLYCNYLSRFPQAIIGDNGAKCYQNGTICNPTYNELNYRDHSLWKYRIHVTKGSNNSSQFLYSNALLEEEHWYSAEFTFN